MTENHFARFRALGYSRLVPIVPPGAPLSEKSSLHRRLHAKNPTDERGKAPGVKWPDGSWSGTDFTKIESTADDCERWHEMGANVGIKTGSGLALIDADTLSTEHAKTILEAVTRHCGGQPPVRIGRYPKAGYLVRTDQDFRYARIEFGERNERGLLKDRVEILSEGRQFVAHGIHPATGKPYRWPQGVPALTDVPFVSGEALMALLTDLAGLLPSASQPTQEGAASDVDQATLRGDWSMVEKAVRATPNNSDLFPTREAWRDYGYAIKAAAGPEHEHDALALFQDWSETWADGENDPDYVAAEWGRFKPPFKRGANWLYELASAHGGGQFSIAEQWFEPVDPNEAPLSPEILPNAFSLHATPYSFPDPTAIPRRQFLYGRHYIRQFVSATVAPSGVGKSSLSIVEALAMASGRPLLGVAVEHPVRVWLWNGEDPRDELERRIAAAMLHYGLTAADIGDRLYVDTGRETEIVLARDTRDGARIVAPVAAAIIEEMRAKRIDAMFVDPFVSSHRVSENDNGAIDLVTKQWSKIADVTGAAIELVHHVRKLNGGEVTVEDSRGAVALLATARSKRALAGMTKVEATRLGVEGSRLRFFRVGDERNNLALPAADDSAWFELRSVGLGNGDCGADGDAVDRLTGGDTVGVVTTWQAARGMAQTGTDEQERAREAIEAGEWRRDVRSGDQWIGIPIAQALRLDVEDPADRARVKSIAGDWIRSGMLREVTRKDEKRRQRVYVEWRQADVLSGDSANSVFE